MKLYRFRGAAPVVCARQASKTPAPADKKPEAGRDGLQGAFRSIWGERSSSGSSSNGAGSSAFRSQTGKQSRKSTVTQRVRRDQNRSEQAVTKGQRNSSAKSRGRFYWNITGFPFPLGPLLKRRTVRNEVSRMEQIWLAWLAAFIWGREAP